MTEARIPTTWVDTPEFNPGEQFAKWAMHGVASRYRPVETGAFFAKGAFWNLGPVVVARAEVDPFVAVRDSIRIAEHPCDHVQIVALLAGSVRFDTGDFIDECCAKCVFICDYARPYRLSTERTRISSAYIARPFLEEVTGPVSAHGLIPASPEGALLTATLANLCNVLPFAAATSVQFYARMLRELIAATLFDEEAVNLSSVEAGLRRRIEALVTAAPPGRIDIEALCRSQGIGRSTLYRLFRRDGGVVTWDRTRRLRSFYHDITNPTDGRVLSEIGVAHGFLDSAGLARIFKAQFGVPASAVRRRARTGSASEIEAETGFERLRRSVSRLSTVSRAAAR